MMMSQGRGSVSDIIILSALPLPLKVEFLTRTWKTWWGKEVEEQEGAGPDAMTRKQEEALPRRP